LVDEDFNQLGAVAADYLPQNMIGIHIFPMAGTLPVQG
jgi:hypothetical protein